MKNMLKNIPDEGQLERLLENVPPDMGIRVDASLAAAPWTRRAVTRRRTTRILALAILAAAILVFATPQGRAWAQAALHFFKHAEGDTLPLQPWQKTAIYIQEETMTAMVTQNITETPFVETETPGPGFSFNKSVTEAGQQAGFDALEPTWIPATLSFAGASYQPDHNIVRIFYRYNLAEPDNTNGLVIREERFQTLDDCSLCGLVGASEPIETVTIGDTTGEYIIGVWTLTDKGPVWESTPYLQTLRWRANGLAFELIYMGIPDVENGVTKTDMIAIAESVK